MYDTGSCLKYGTKSVEGNVEWITYMSILYYSCRVIRFSNCYCESLLFQNIKSFDFIIIELFSKIS